MGTPYLELDPISTRMDEQEAARLDALYRLDLLDTPPAEAFDRITRMAAQLFNLPIAAISLTDADRQWFKSRVGVSHNSIPRERAPCAQVADSCAPLVIPDLQADPCYCNSHLGRSGIRFYAGAPLVTDDGYSLGAMCVLGVEPREATTAELAALSDLAAMVMSQIELQHALGRIDPVSGLPNRKQFREDFEDLSQDLSSVEARLLVLLNLARPEEVSDAVRVMGAGYFEELVRQAAVSLKSVLGPGYTVYHVAETQFAYFAPADTKIDTYGRLLTSRLDAHRRTATTRFVTTTAIGIAPFLLGQADYSDVLRMAHSAAQDAFETDSRVCIYSSAQDAAHLRRFALLSRFGAALEDTSRLHLAYQPRIDIQSGACIGAEALLRWNDPVLGAVSPGEFMPIVEQSSMARAVTEWVLDIAVLQLKRWQKLEIELVLSVNISACNLAEPDFVERLVATLNRHQVEARYLELELTESAVMTHPAKAQAVLEQIAQVGVRLAIDDFGTGYSSLAYLQSLPTHVVKIDQSFVRNLNDSQRRRMLVATMVELSHDLGYRVVAEGVETAEALAFLASAGCDEAQGYLFAKPMPPQELAAWLESRAQQA